MVDPKEASLSAQDEEGTGQGLPPAESVNVSDLTSNILGSRTLTETDLEKSEEDTIERLT